MKRSSSGRSLPAISNAFMRFASVFVAQAGPEIVGFMAVSLDLEKKVGEIGLNAVHPDWSGQGIGTQLYAFAVEFMREVGMAVAAVGTGGDPSHAAARRAYEKAGFDAGIPSVWLYKRL
jgi:GNAT superfamily N-acetyltransferase